jgi:TolA-binding protein
MKNKLNAERLNIWTALAWLFVATSLVFAGCSRQIANVRDSQVKLQNIMQVHSQQITTNMAALEDVTNAVNDIEQKQTAMQERITTLQGDNQLLREQMITMLKQFKEQLSQISVQVGSSATAGR